MVSPAILGTLIKKPSTATPLTTYGANLKWWYDSQTGFSGSGTSSATWLDRVASVPLTEDANDHVASQASYFGTPATITGIQFKPSSGTDLDRRQQSASSVFDNLWAGSGSKNLAFACKMETMSWLGGIGLSAIVTKGHGNPGQAGWGLYINQSGDLKFKAVTSGGSTWDLEVSSYYLTRQLIIGSITFDGVWDQTPNITIRLWSGTSWQNVPYNIFGSNISVNDSVGKFSIANQSDETFPQPLHGAVGSMWFTKPALTSLNDVYLARYL